MSKWLTNNLSKAKDLLAQAMTPVYRVINSAFVVAVFMVVGLWLSGNGTNAGAFDLARILVPDEARHIVWSNGFGMLEQYKAANDSPSQMADSEIAAVLYSKSNPIPTDLHSAKQQTVALLMPSVGQIQVKSISHLADRIPTSRIDPEALDSNLMSSIQNQRAVADFFEKKYNQIYSGGNPFATPTNIPSNIDGGAYGVWVGYSPWYDTIICQ